jgi:hypothetical protein
VGRAPESVYLKLVRAQEHLKAFNAQLAEWTETNPYMLHFEMHDDRRQVAVKLAVLREPPTELGIIVGDCVHNLRGVLDHLAFTLPRSAGTDPRWEEWSQFPICDAPTGFKSSAPRYLLGVDPNAVTAVEGLQPYFGGNSPEGHGLWYLRNLSNEDKHRLIPTVWYVPASASIEIPHPPTGTAHIVFATGSLEHGATIAKVYFSDPAPHGMTMTLNLTVGITLRDIEPPGEPKVGVNLVLERVYERVVNAIGTLEPFLP